jgi:short-subunit dehydrogenase
MRKILIIGATSAIASETARLFAAEGAALCLVARDAVKLDVVAADLRVLGALQVETFTADLTDRTAHAALIARAVAAFGGLDVVLIAHGTLSDQKACEQHVELALHELDTNFLSCVALLTHLANYFEAQKSGTIAVISSVAGDRGRKSNYVYGTAKAALTTFLQGLRNRLQGAGVHVLTIKPGFVDTPMTAAIVKKGLLFATPQGVARGIHRAILARRDVVYLPWFWRFIMCVIRAIPEAICKRMSL